MNTKPMLLHQSKTSIANSIILTNAENNITFLIFLASKIGYQNTDLIVDNHNAKLRK